MRKRLSLLGGDRREIVVANTLIKAGYNIKTFALPKVELVDESLCQSSLFQAVENTDIIILPVKGLDENGFLYAPCFEEKIKITEDDFKHLEPSTIIFTGVASKYLQKLGESLGLKVIPLMELDPIAIPNAIPTAEGALSVAIEKSPKTVNKARVLILGFGRVGKATADIFRNVGARVSLCSRNLQETKEAIDLGYDMRCYSGLARVIPHADIVINTVPAMVLTDDILAYADENVLIIDLASKPGGVDFDAAARRKINAVHSLGLPGKCAPVTAGMILAEGIMVLLEGEGV